MQQTQVLKPHSNFTCNACGRDCQTAEPLQKLPSKGLTLSDQGASLISQDKRMPPNTARFDHHLP